MASLLYIVSDYVSLITCTSFCRQDSQDSFLANIGPCKKIALTILAIITFPVVFLLVMCSLTVCGPCILAEVICNIRIKRNNSTKNIQQEEKKDELQDV